MRAMVTPLGSQQASKAAMSSSFRTMSGFFSNGSRASAGLFLEATARTMPRSASALACFWNAVKASPSADLAERDAERARSRRPLRPRRCCRGRAPAPSWARWSGPGRPPRGARESLDARLAERLLGPVIAPHVVERSRPIMPESLSRSTK